MHNAAALKAEIAGIEAALDARYRDETYREVRSRGTDELRAEKYRLMDLLDALTARPADGIYRTVDQLEACGSYAWPGGYPLAFYPCDRHGDMAGVVLCLDCAKSSLEDDDDFGILAEVEDSDQQYYGGVTCDGCGDPVVEPDCPECGDSLFDGTALMHADDVDASLLHRRCAAEMVGRHAVRKPGIGIEIAACRNGDYHTWRAPWYAPVGTVYSYR